jgi:electron transport complex protein RnfG
LQLRSKIDNGLPDHSLVRVLLGALLMGLFAFVGVGGVMLIHQQTYDQIQLNLRQDTLRAMHRLLPESEYDNDLLAEPINLGVEAFQNNLRSVVAYRAERNHQPVATLFSLVTPKGYNGDIRLLMAVRQDGTLTGVEIVSHSETPGLGDRIESARSDWLEQFRGTSLDSPSSEDWKVRRDGGRFDQLTGATVTPRAVVNALHRVLVYLKQHDIGASPGAGTIVRQPELLEDDCLS